MDLEKELQGLLKGIADLPLEVQGIVAEDIVESAQ